MNKKLILVVLLSALMLFCFAWVYARHADQTKETTITKERPSTQTLMELRELAKQVKPDMVPVPDVKLEDMPPLPHVKDIERIPLQQELSQKGKEAKLFDPAQTMDKMRNTAVPVPLDANFTTMRDGEEIQRPLTECLIYVHQYETCCYLHPAGEMEWACWDVVRVATLNDPQQDAGMSACGYPIYPFEVHGVEIILYLPDTSLVMCQFALLDYYWDHCSPFPYYPEIVKTDTLYFDQPSGYVYMGATFDPPICVYDRFFAAFYLLNSNDYLDPDYCPDAPYQWQPSAIFDQSGWCERTYWDPYGPSYWYDAVCELPAYGLGWPGVVRVRAWGATGDENQCPDSVFMWQKEAFYEEDTLGNVTAYAPCGVPDFDQKYKEELHPEIDAPWDGPAALANCMW